MYIKKGGPAGGRLFYGALEMPGKGLDAETP